MTVFSAAHAFLRYLFPGSHLTPAELAACRALAGEVGTPDPSVRAQLLDQLAQSEPDRPRV